MPPKSKISKFPDEIKGLVKKLLKDGASIEKITNKLNELDYDVSRSSVGRYTKNLNEVIERYQEIHHFAEALGSSAEDKSHGEIARMNSQLLQGSLFKVMMGDGTKDVTLDAMEVMRLATALEKLSKAAKLDTDRELQIREEVERQTKLEAFKAVDKVAKSQGITKETVSKIKAEILGAR